MFLFPVQVCANTLSARLPSRICNNPLDEHAPVVATDHFNHEPVVTGTVPPAFPAESREIDRSVMESTECGESKSDLGWGNIDAACLCCVAGSDWWVNCNNLLVGVGLGHED